ncbi:MAG TPA: cytochrome c oxidase subunit II [Gemmatimonadaceae bacterium]|nr:cytochrome c oxidase subunit II [Gemmatimonadaceae bacterium]
MTPNHRPRRLFGIGLAAVLALALAACSQDYPNSTFNPNTDLNADIDFLFDRLMFWGTIVFVLVEVMLVWTIIKFRRRDGQNAEPKQIHGHTLLEIMWTAIPALILVFIAVPTVRTIFRTQAPAAPGSLQVEVIGHQWWWEFRYPELGIVTANEIYVPVGRTVNFALKTKDVLHSFWIPQLGGKRDLISNRTNYMWFTPDSTMLSEAQVWNGFCAEFCGVSHANMKFRVVTVTPDQFESWVAHQKTPAAFGAQPTAQPTAAAAPGATAPAQAADSAATTALAQAAAAPAGGEGYVFPRENLPVHAIPTSKIPRGLTISDEVLAKGDPERGRELWMTARGGCVGCHAIEGTPFNMSTIGPNLTHFGSRLTLAAGMYPNDARHLALWIKNARAMKHGVIMPTLGAGQFDPVTKATVTQGGLTDEQIADYVAYLMALK